MYQCKKTFLLNIWLKLSNVLSKTFEIEVEFPKNVTELFLPFGGTLQSDVFMLFGIH
jgi:hypothetical protein